LNLSNSKALRFNLNTAFENIYTPKGVPDDAPLVTFTQGANQWMSENRRRAKHLAETVGVRLLLVHNGSYVKENVKNEDAAMRITNRLRELVDTVNMANWKTVPDSSKNMSQLMVKALEDGKPAYFSGHSQGSLVVGQALELAKQAYMKKHKVSEAQYEKVAAKTLNVLTFGNVCKMFHKGPNYLHVYIKGDSFVEHGTKPDNVPPGVNAKFLVFEKMFPDTDTAPNDDNHNIAMVLELMNKTMEMKGLKRGDIPGLFRLPQIDQSTLPTAKDVNWPASMVGRLWDKKNESVMMGYVNQRRVQNDPRPR
jgi:hypothetical protein